MIKPSKAVFTVFGAVAILLLAACSTTTLEPVTTIIAQPMADDKSVATEVTVGSRIPRKSTDRLVHRTDAAGAKDMERARPPSPGVVTN